MISEVFSNLNDPMKSHPHLWACRGSMARPLQAEGCRLLPWDPREMWGSPRPSQALSTRRPCQVSPPCAAASFPKPCHGWCPAEPHPKLQA